jgi:hypothetical protein
VSHYENYRAKAATEAAARFAETLYQTRADWPVDLLTEFLRTQGERMPLEVLMLALTISHERQTDDGSWLLAQPADVLDGPWLTIAQMLADQLDAEARDRAARQ